METMSDFKLRGGRLAISRVILPCLTASSEAMILEMWKLSRNGLLGLSSA